METRNHHCWIMAAVIVAVLALAGMADGATLDGTEHCDGYPEWDAHYDALRGFTSAAGEAIMWFESQGCTMTGTEPEGWPECDESISCDGTVAVEVSDTGHAHAAAVARASAGPGRIADTARSAAPGGIAASARSAAQRYTRQAAGARCDFVPTTSVTPLSAPVGASITASLINSETSAPFQITDDQRAAWSVTPGGAQMLLTWTDTSRSTFTVQSAGPGSATISVEVCGETRTINVAWSEKKANLSMFWSVASILGGVAVGVLISKGTN